MNKNISYLIVNKVILQNYFITGFVWSFFTFFSIFTAFEFNENLFVDCLVVFFNFYLSFTIVFIFLSNILEGVDNKYFNILILTRVVYFLLFFYYFVVVIRYSFFDLNEGFYGFRFLYGLISPFFILSPLFILNVRFRFNFLLCLICCFFEVIFCLFLNVFSDHIFLNRSYFFSIVINSLFFSIIFPYFFSFLKGIGSLKLLKKNTLFNVLSGISLFFGLVFLIFFYLFF